MECRNFSKSQRNHLLACTKLNCFLQFRIHHFMVHILLLTIFGLLTGSKDFGWAVPFAAKIGTNFAQTEIRELFEKSDLFRAALAEPKLKKIAEEISNREEQRKAGKYYPFSKFLLDKDRLFEAAKESGLTKDYADDFFKDYEGNRMSGTLFWTYHSNKDFMWQWIYAGLVFFIVSQITIRIKRQLLPKLDNGNNPPSHYEREWFGI